jgi:GntR family transcriptional repressor for pyruvate dehydrogenase complex
MKSEFAVVKRPKVYEEVARQIERLILKKLSPGDKLPAERELAEMLGVSRSSIRDAVRSLELVGLVEPRQGAGTVVCEISAMAVANPLTNAIVHKRQLVGELLDFRRILEPALAARAAEHADAEDIAELEAILHRQGEKVRSGELAIEEDSAFHYRIALASGNSVVLRVLNVLMDLLRETRSKSLQMEGRPKKSLAGHKRILSAIARRDAAAAETTMKQHIQDIEEMVLEKI